MLISFNSTCKYKDSLLNSFLKTNRRYLFSLSRFQPSPKTNTTTKFSPTPTISSLHSSSSSSTASLSISSSNSALDSALCQLQNSIISKIQILSVDKLKVKNQDLNLINEKSTTKPKLSQIDQHILSISKILTTSSNHQNNDYFKQKILNFKFDKINDDKLYRYKYNLINDHNSIVELHHLTEFVDRLTSHNYLNSNEQIKHFLKYRILFDNEMRLLLKKNKSLAYSMIKFFTKNPKNSDTQMIYKIIDSIDGWDTHSLNILLKNSNKLISSTHYKLKTIDSILDKFLFLNLKLNITSIYLIYMYIHKTTLDSYNCTNLKYFLQDLFFQQGLTHKTQFTSLLFDDLKNSYFLLNKLKRNSINSKNDQIIDYIKKDSIKSISLLSKTKFFDFLDINIKNYSIKSIRKAYLYTKFKDINSFDSLISSHLIDSNWKKAWDIATSPQKVLFDNRHNKVSYNWKSKLLHDNSPSKYSNFGEIFNYNHNCITELLNNRFGYKLCNYLSSNCNWQLFLRSINTLDNNNNNNNNNDKNLNWNIFNSALKMLVNTNFDKNHLDPLTHLILIKFLINKALQSDLGPYKRWDVLFRNLQLKADQIHKTDFSNIILNLENKETVKVGNVHRWMEKIRWVRALRENSGKFKLFDSYFVHSNNHLNNDYDRGIVFKENSQNSQNLTTNLKNSENMMSFKMISPDLSIITPFESIIFEHLSNLEILDTEFKVMNEYKTYSRFWNSKNINHKDVLTQYHLGFINKSYKFDKIKWEKIKCKDDLKISEEISDLKLHDIKSEKISKINDTIHENLTNLLNNSEEYIAMEIVHCKNEKKAVKIDTINNSLNLLPNDWMYMVIDKCLSDWIVDQIIKK